MPYLIITTQKILRLCNLRSDFGDISKWEVVLDERESHYIEDMLTFNEHIVIQSRFDGIPLIEILNIEPKKMSQQKWQMKYMM